MPVNPPPARAHPYHQGSADFRKTIAFNTGGIGTAGQFCLGTLPKGAIVTNGGSRTNTAFNAATTNVVNFGVAGTPAAIGTLTPGAVGAIVNITPGYKATADTPVFVQYTQTGTAATAGEADVYLFFLLDNG